MARKGGKSHPSLFFFKQKKDKRMADGLELMSLQEVVPGRIIIGYMKENFPLCIGIGMALCDDELRPTIIEYRIILK